jgi:putative hemolysin
VAWLWVVVALLVVLGAVLAVAEASISRMSRARAGALREEGRRGAGVLERIESEPVRYLNAIYLAVMLAQNGSAILVAVLAGWAWGGLGVTVASIVFTLAYFVVVEAMAKTFGILHGDRAALAVAPLVYTLGRALAVPAWLLIGLANVLLPGKGLRHGPFVSEEEIRSLTEVAHEEGVIERHEKEMILSVFEFGDTVVREVMVPRPDIVAIDAGATLDAAQEAIVRHGFSRIPVHRGGLDRVEGLLYAKDVLRALRRGGRDTPVTEILRPVRFVPESKRLAELLREMQREQFHLALVTDEYGSVSGLVTLEDLLEELVGEIADEYDRDEPQVQLLPDGGYRVNARLSINDLNELLDADLPHEAWDTVGGLVLGLLGEIPTEGREVVCERFRFKVEKVQGRRIATVLITRLRDDEQPAA